MELVINFSGGKDSSAMLAFLCERYPNVRKHVVMADTGWEHTDAIPWSQGIVERFGLELHVVRNPNKTFLSMVEKRGMFPSSGQRQCTSDLKRDPIRKWIRNNVKADVIINCMGMRSEESAGRARLPCIRLNEQLTKSGRQVWDWHPILGWKEHEVRLFLAERNIPLHPVYKHLRRFSCRVCIFMSKHDIQQVKLHDPEAIRTINELEQRIGFTMRRDGPITTH